MTTPKAIRYQVYKPYRPFFTFFVIFFAIPCTPRTVQNRYGRLPVLVMVQLNYHFIYALKNFASKPSRSAPYAGWYLPEIAVYVQPD